MHSVKTPLRRALAALGLATTAIAAGALFGVAGYGNAASAPSGCPAGKGPIKVADLTLPARLMVDQWKSNPSVIGRTPGTVTVSAHVTACGGRDVSGALVYVTATPWDQFSTPSEAATGADGWATLSMAQADHFPASRRQELLAVFVRARKPGEAILGGVSTRRLVSFKVDLSQ
jgi:hypothetical protein